MNWPFVLKSRYVELENKYNTEIDNLAQIACDVRREFNILKLILADLKENNSKLSQNNMDLLFAKKDLKQKIRKLESENSKLKTTNKQLQAIHKTLGFFIHKAYEQLNK